MGRCGIGAPTICSKGRLTVCRYCTYWKLGTKIDGEIGEEISKSPGTYSRFESTRNCGKLNSGRLALREILKNVLTTKPSILEFKGMSVVGEICRSIKRVSSSSFQIPKTLFLYQCWLIFTRLVSTLMTTVVQLFILTAWYTFSFMWRNYFWGFLSLQHSYLQIVLSTELFKTCLILDGVHILFFLFYSKVYDSLFSWANYNFQILFCLFHSSICCWYWLIKSSSVDSKLLTWFNDE